MQRLSFIVAVVVGAFVVAVDCGQNSGTTEQLPASSKPGGAGHALLFRDHIIVKKDFKSFPSTDFTFEAWISTSDYCHSGAIISYAKDSKSPDPAQRIADFNHFVIFDAKNILACHDFEYIDLIPDKDRKSCHSQFNTTTSFIERDGTWHHLAVTWTTKNNGYTEIYKDGLLISSAQTGKTEPLVPDGALVIGGEQDCFGGCTDPEQAFYGMMDEVRIWKSVRTHQEILANMRLTSGLEGHKDLVAYWKFNEPDEDSKFVSHLVARDSSGKGNDLSLATLPQDSFETIIKKQDNQVKELHTGSLRFKNNFGLKKDTNNMPDKDFSIEFWARGQKLSDEKDNQDKISEFISFAALRNSNPDDRTGQQVLLDDAIRIQRYLEDYSDTLDSGTSTMGAISVHVNSNEHTDSWLPENWIDFDAKWTDDEWHHIAVTWQFETGETRLYMDGNPITPFWKSDAGAMEDTDPKKGGVDPHIAAKTTRSATGSLVLGMDQNCYGGCFSPATSFDGNLAVLRIWSRVVTQEEVKANMFMEHPQNAASLSALYVFTTTGLHKATDTLTALDLSGNKNDLTMRSSPPEYIYSSAPLTDNAGVALPPPQPGAAGYALALHDKQVVILPDFQDFPSTALTLEFWMLSVDRCRPGVPFSYAAGAYDSLDNSFLLFNYNSWGVGVMEDEGTRGDHTSGISSTDGTWHHIAVTWESKTGNVVLYDNGRQVWAVKRAQGKKIPSGGTLVVGREQDCVGGCFDSAAGASGKVDPIEQQQYSSQGPQDFFGLVEEMRLWKVVRTPQEILEGIRGDSGEGRSNGNRDDSNLVAYWKFDEPGFVVKDHTGHGHDLKITAEPRFEVVKWLSNCGNGIVEGAEECDDGDNDDNNGCSRHCTINPGWTCQGSPSVCTRKGSHSGGGKPQPPAPHKGGSDTPDSGSSSGSSHKASGGMSGAGIAALVIFSILGVVGMGFAWAHREAIMYSPLVENSVDAVRSAFGRVLPGRRTYHDLTIDPEELDVSPEFLQPLPARTAPGHHGSYVPIPFPPPRGEV